MMREIVRGMVINIEHGALVGSLGAATGYVARASPSVARRLCNLPLMFVPASIIEVRFPGPLLLTREIETLPFVLVECRGM